MFCVSKNSHLWCAPPTAFAHFSIQSTRSFQPGERVQKRLLSPSPPTIRRLLVSPLIKTKIACPENNSHPIKSPPCPLSPLCMGKTTIEVIGGAHYEVLDGQKSDRGEQYEKGDSTGQGAGGQVIIVVNEAV